jgi:hypothetical protein
MSQVATLDWSALRAQVGGAVLERLAQVKATYDPENFFHINNNIQPA